MRRVCICCCLAGLLSFNGQAQSDSVTLGVFSKARSAQFAREQQKVRAYSESHNKPVFFNDENGNPVYMVGFTPSGLPIYYSTLNAGAAITTNVLTLQSGGALGLNMLGEGMLVGIWDGGRIKDHIELGQRVIAKQGTTDDNHATHVTGTLIATGNNASAKGMAPLAKANTHDFLDDEAEMAALAQTNLLFSNHSYGTVTGWLKKGTVWEWTGDPAINPIEDYRFGFYDTRAQSIDQIAWLAPYYTIVWAAGNDRADTGEGSKPADCNGGSGYDCIIPEGVSKNVITVGAVNKVMSYTNPFDVSMSFFSCWGPTDDGRIKPDLVGAGVNLFSLSSNGTDTYTTMSGTSMATPNVTGSLLLLQELYSKIHGGDFMKAATLKALSIHTAREAGNFPGPDYAFGWGLLDAGAAAAIVVGQDDQSRFMKELTLRNDSIFQLPLHPKPNQKITATIAWTDVPGSPLAPAVDPGGLMLVNDLDSRIIDEQGREQLPWMLDPSNPTKQATKGDNFRDNVEKIEFDLPEGKNYTMVVRHKKVLVGGKQDFSLIVSYKPIQEMTTFYWIGDSGSWTDGSHWSMSSGGPSVMSVPGPADRIVVDENSFDGFGTDGISISQDVAVDQLLWLNSRPSGISLNNNTLAVGSQWIICDPDFAIQSKGNIYFLPGQVPGNFFAQNNGLPGATLIFEGNWNTKGNFSADEIRINSGSLMISSSQVELDRLVANSTAPGKELKLNNSTITLNESSSLDGNSLAIASVNSSIVAGAYPALEWEAVNFPGEVRIGPASQLTVNGANHLGTVYNEGNIILNGSNWIDTLITKAGAEMKLGSSSVQTLSAQAQFLGTNSKPISILSPTSATLVFSDHAKFCFDFLNVTNVEVKGNAVVSAGINSILVNAGNWQQAECADVLFADFDVRYNCAHAAVEFMDKSSGPVKNYAWRFGNNLEEVHLANPSMQFDSPGNYKVYLTVTGNNHLDSVSMDIEIIPNPFPGNQIVSNSGVLTSFLIGSSYQWFKDGLALPDETNRSYEWAGVEGIYYVIAYEGQCNVLSDTLAITGLDHEADDIEVYPNPVSSDLTIKVPGRVSGRLTLTDFLGERCLQGYINQREMVLSTRLLPEGVYVLEVALPNMTSRRKIVILHGNR